jgi:CheY-like chemotaxis protein
MASAQILVVEDESIIALDIQNRLKTLGYSVPTIASSGEEALQKATASHPDLVLMDIVLKGDMDGIDTAERLAMLNIPIVYLTAYADAQTLQRAKATGPFGYILKPFTAHQLQSTIEIALHKHRLDRQMAYEWLTAKKLDALGTIAGGIAHEFNTLFTAITQEPLFAHLTAAAQASQRAAEVTQQLLTFATGGAPVKQLTGLGPILQDITRSAVDSPDVQCVLSIADDLWPVEADPNQIKQVIDQLIHDAVQAMPQGGTLTVQAANVPHGEAPLPCAREPYVRISITDQGSGIPPEHLDRIFDLYFTTKTHRGLGLTIAGTIVQRHAGHMTVDSTPGQGTTVCVYLLAAPASLPPQEVVSPPPVAGQHKVLIMDDEESVRTVLTQMLTQLGYTVASARDGAEALLLYRRAKDVGQPYTIVLMDLTVAAGMGGEETIAELRQVDPEVKAIVSSGNFNDPVMANFQHYGFSGVLAKPYTLAELQAVLRHVIGGQSGERAAGAG